MSSRQCPLLMRHMSMGNNEAAEGFSLENLGIRRGFSWKRRKVKDEWPGNDGWAESCRGMVSDRPVWWFIVKADVTRQNHNGGWLGHIFFLQQCSVVLSLTHNLLNKKNHFFQFSWLNFTIFALDFLAQVSRTVDCNLHSYGCLHLLKSWRTPPRWRGSSQSHRCPWKGDAAGPSLSRTNTHY